jgi:hypothetical protein
MANANNHSPHVARHVEHCDAATAESKITSPYALLLREPMSTIVTNVPDRPDVSSVSILGYN